MAAYRRARLPIEALENSTVPPAPGREEESVDTLGGLVFVAGRVPKRGEVIAHPDGIEFEVLDCRSAARQAGARARLPAAIGKSGAGGAEAAALRVQPRRRGPEDAALPARAGTRALSGWRRYGLGFVLGALLAGALPPLI